MSENAQYDVVVQVEIDAGRDEIPVARLESAIEWVLTRHTVAAGSNVSVVVTDNEAVQELNRTYRDTDRPTDVLSFPAEPLPFIEDEVTLGDLILALPYIQVQAQREGHDWRDEMVLVVIHGTLHLLDYDHDTPENQAAMWAVQSEALAAMGVKIVVPLFEFDADDDDESGESAQSSSSHKPE